MERPEKRKLEKNSPYLQYDKGYNHSHGNWEAYLIYLLSTDKYERHIYQIEETITLGRSGIVGDRDVEAIKYALHIVKTIHKALKENND